MNNWLESFLPVLAQALQLPVTLGLLAGAAMTVVYLGGFCAEAWSRWRYAGEFHRLIARLKRGSGTTLQFEEIRFGFPARVLLELSQTPAAVDKILDDAQIATERALGKLHFGVRLGPMLGLAGTLIPLGPALRTLGNSDFNNLGEQLIVSFSSTVVGLFIGALCFVMYAIRQRWYTQDLNDLEFVARTLIKPQEAQLIE